MNSIKNRKGKSLNRWDKLPAFLGTAPLPDLVLEVHTVDALENIKHGHELVLSEQFAELS